MSGIGISAVLQGLRYSQMRVSLFLTEYGKRKKFLMNVKKKQREFIGRLWYDKYIKNRSQTNRFAVYIEGEAEHGECAILLLRLSFL